MDREDFLQDFPEFSDTDIPIINRGVEYAKSLVDTSVLTETKDQNKAIGLLTAHYIQLTRDKGKGLVTSKSIEGISTTYAVHSQGSTVYESLYIQFIKSKSPRVIVV
ncbi:MAG: hypothetical protein OMM_06623 [Candidatus Magnetoglobus multicellularis str. Araruama]|uniref:Uncharacterized protein n=1 Tax=Candidatus Magnetoglobus multicellularis str. Araruama TaxID=890399 RepID=A0A1V1PGS2_9BACT|nr:MAG: hypothetical protein OMM_06623 [Candidatus Magnetoglobus multicellularis str. Araruama]